MIIAHQVQRGVLRLKKVRIGKNVTIAVDDRATGEGVEDAKVWALGKDEAQSIREEIAGLRGSGDSAAIETAINAHAAFLGTTNGAGKLNCKFEYSGGYLLVTYKAGYLPGTKIITIVPELSPGRTNPAASANTRAG